MGGIGGANNVANNVATPNMDGLDGRLPMTAWFRLVSWSLDEVKRRRPQQAPFVSLMLPQVVAETIAEHLTGRGYCAHITEGYTSNTRSLTIWSPPLRPALAAGRIHIVDTSQ